MLGEIIIRTLTTLYPLLFGFEFLYFGIYLSQNITTRVVVQQCKETEEERFVQKLHYRLPDYLAFPPGIKNEESAQDCFHLFKLPSILIQT
jgi:hypothetical protein